MRGEGGRGEKGEKVEEEEERGAAERGRSGGGEED